LKEELATIKGQKVRLGRGGPFGGETSRHVEGEDFAKKTTVQKKKKREISAQGKNRHQ